MKNYIVFFTNGNVELANFLTKRATQLGYSGNSAMPNVSVTLCRNTGDILWTDQRSMKNDYIAEDHEFGDFEKFLTTDKYRYEEPIMVAGHNVIFNKDGSLTIGCTTVKKEIVDKIVKKVRDCDY